MKDKQNGTITIDRGIPLPQNGKAKGVSATLRQLKVGDSFILPNPAVRNGLSGLAARLQIKIATRTTPDGLRVWRIQ